MFIIMFVSHTLHTVKEAIIPRAQPINGHVHKECVV